jgi:DNA mismatch endonuclease (patch repair protein)
MADIFTVKQRSFIMSRIKGQNTKPERIVCALLRANGIRFTANCKSLPGKPDIVLKDEAFILFVHGCFWHGHKRCKHFKWPKSNKQYWRRKIEANRRRDAKRLAQLRELGWRTAIVWECQLRKNAISTLEKVLRKAFRH